MKMLFLMTFIITTSDLHAQNFEEWFNQKQTRIKYMLQQVAANKFYIDYIQKGYRIAQSGLQTISDIRHGDFNLHSAFFNALSTVNPKIKNLAKVVDIIAFQIQIIKASKTIIQKIKASNQFTSLEAGYVQNVFDHLLDECTKSINELIIVITSGEIEMTDDERIKGVDRIYYSMQDKFSFCKSFSDGAIMLAIQRASEQTDIDIVKKLNGVQ
jgi:5-methylcytosine-specific restriction endonuclease McrBC GTP-binding regulatory subunit McrB